MLYTDAVATTLIRFVAGQVDEEVTKYVHENRDGDETTVLSVDDEDAHDEPPKTRKPKSHKTKYKV